MPTSSYVQPNSLITKNFRAPPLCPGETFKNSIMYSNEQHLDVWWSWNNAENVRRLLLNYASEERHCTAVPCCTPFSLPSISLHIREEEMLLTLPSSSIIHLMEDWNCVSATAQILYQTRCATAALPPSCLLVVVAFLCARHLPSPLISSLSCIVTRWHLQARLRPTPSVSDQHYTMTTVIEIAEPERSPLL